MCPPLTFANQILDVSIDWDDMSAIQNFFTSHMNSKQQLTFENVRIVSMSVAVTINVTVTLSITVMKQTNGPIMIT